MNTIEYILKMIYLTCMGDRGILFKDILKMKLHNDRIDITDENGDKYSVVIIKHPNTPAPDNVIQLFPNDRKAA